LGNYKKPAKPNDKLIHFIKSEKNTSKAHIKEVPDSKLASLDYTIFKRIKQLLRVRNKSAYRKTPSNHNLAAIGSQ
jgi:23S rRNA pseudouridine1911/1915/1917 synthase